MFEGVTVKFVDNEKGNPPGKLADAELHFASGVFAGLKLIGFAIWERRTGGGRNLTFPARSYAVNGERRSFALLRPTADAHAQDTLRDFILGEYAKHERGELAEAPAVVPGAPGTATGYPDLGAVLGAGAARWAESEARRLWALFSANERAMVRLGMFPADKMLTGAEARSEDDTRRLCAALMDLAKHQAESVSGGGASSSASDAAPAPRLAGSSSMRGGAAGSKAGALMF